MNGIPQAFAPNNLAQQVADLRRKVEALTSARTYVNLANVTVTEGGTIDENVGKQLTETVQKDIVIDGGNLGEGALDGKRMVGAIIETNATANRGMKIDDTGMRGYDADGNRYMLADETGLEMTGSISTNGKTGEATPRDIAVRLTTVARDMLGQTNVPNPALVFSTDDAQVGLAPGIYSADGRTITIKGAGFDFAMMEIGDVAAKLRAHAVEVSDLYGQGTISLLGSNIAVGHDGNLFGPATDVNLLGNVKVNGLPLSDSGWLNATYLNSWVDYGRGFGGLQYRLLNGVLYLRGTIKGGTTNSFVSTLPAGFRPIIPSGTQAMEFPITAKQGSTWYSGTMYVYANGDLRYDAPPGTWGGATDRVIINTSFPL